MYTVRPRSRLPAITLRPRLRLDARPYWEAKRRPCAGLGERLHPGVLLRGECGEPERRADTEASSCPETACTRPDRGAPKGAGRARVLPSLYLGGEDPDHRALQGGLRDGPRRLSY